MIPSNAVWTDWDAEAIDNLAPRLSANPKNCYHALQFGVHSGNPEYMPMEAAASFPLTASIRPATGSASKLT